MQRRPSPNEYSHYQLPRPEFLLSREKTAPKPQARRPASNHFLPPRTSDPLDLLPKYPPLNSSQDSSIKKKPSHPRNTQTFLYAQPNFQNPGVRRRQYSQPQKMTPGDDQSTLCGEQVLRPSSFRPSSATKPDRVLPKDVLFYAQNRPKVHSQVEAFYDDEKRVIADMVDECLKTIITLFEGHKKKLFQQLDSDKQNFLGVYARFCEKVDLFVKDAERNMESTLGAYQAKVSGLQTDELNPLKTEMERLRLDQGLIDSQKKVFSEIIRDYEKSTIPGDQKTVAALVVDGHKKRHSLNVGALARHMQDMIGSLRGSVERFNGFQSYTQGPTEQLEEGVPKKTLLNLEHIPENHPGQVESNLLESEVSLPFHLTKNSNIMASNLYQQQLFLQNLALSQDPGNQQKAYQMMLLNKQLNLGSQFPGQKTANYVNQNYEGAIVKPHISGNLNVNINAMESQQWGVGPNALGTMERGNPAQVHSDWKTQKAVEANKKGRTEPKSKLIQQKDVVFGLESSGFGDSRVSGGSQGAPRLFRPDAGPSLLHNIDQDIRNLQNPPPRATSPILRARQSVQKLSNIYQTSQQKVQEYKNTHKLINKSALVPKGPENIEYPNHPPRVSRPLSTGKQEDTRRQTMPKVQKVSKLVNRLGSSQQRVRVPTEETREDPSGLLEKLSLKKRLLQPKSRKKLESGRFGGKFQGNYARPASQKVKSFHAKQFKSKETRIRQYKVEFIMKPFCESYWRVPTLKKRTVPEAKHLDEHDTRKARSLAAPKAALHHSAQNLPPDQNQLRQEILFLLQGARRRHQNGEILRSGLRGEHSAGDHPGQPVDSTPNPGPEREGLRLPEPDLQGPTGDDPGNEAGPGPGPRVPGEVDAAAPNKPRDSRERVPNEAQREGAPATDRLLRRALPVRLRAL